MNDTIIKAETLADRYKMLAVKETEIAQLLTEIERLKKETSKKRAIIFELERIRFQRGQEVEQILEVLNHE